MPRLELAVDANPLISALLGGQALKLLYSPLFLFVTTELTTWKVKKYIPEIAERLEISEIEMLETFEDFPLVAYQSDLIALLLMEITSRI